MDTLTDADIELANLAQKSAEPSLHHAVGRLQSRIPSHPAATFRAEESPEQLQAYAVKERLQFATLCFTLFLAGWNDGSSGPLLPRIQNVYSVGIALGLITWKY